MNNQFILKSFFSVILTTLILSTALTASNNDKEVLLEITDRYKEVKLGITNSTVYMVIDERIRSQVNVELQNIYNKEFEDFNDSEGNFIPTEHIYLQSNIIEISFDSISKVEFNNGALSFDYSSNIRFPFENIISQNGHRAIDNFYVEDLELFFQAFQNLN